MAETPETRFHKPTKRFKAPTEQQRKLVKGVIHEGKSFHKSALDAGYAESVAKQGLAIFRKQSIGVDVAFIEESKKLNYTPAELLAISKSRLISDITRGKSSGTERAIEVLGKFKDLDWFVRNADVQIGVFASLAEEDSVKTLEATALPEEPKP